MTILEELDRITAEIHRDCKADNPRCACACGCAEQIGCTCWAPVCTDCQMNWIRERSNEPGIPDCEPPDAARDGELEAAS